jgi:hypothetical protein
MGGPPRALTTTEQPSNHATVPLGCALICPRGQPLDSPAAERILRLHWLHVWYHQGRYQIRYHIWKEGETRLCVDLEGDSVEVCSIICSEVLDNPSPPHDGHRSVAPAQMDSTWRPSGHQMQSSRTAFRHTRNKLLPPLLKNRTLVPRVPSCAASPPPKDLLRARASPRRAKTVGS